MLILGVGLNISFVGDYGRDEVFLKDMKLVLDEIGNEKTISITKKEKVMWEWHSYFARYADVGLDCKNLHEYLLISNPKHLQEFDLQDKYILVDIETESLLLYKKIIE